eukprot:917424-Amphidinium_carterae.2
MGWCHSSMFQHDAKALRQSVIATSSPEAEYLGACAAVADGLYVQEILKFFGFPTTVRLGWMRPAQCQ